MTASQIIETVNALPACYAFETGCDKVQVTYRGKKSDKVFINAATGKVSFVGNIETIAIKIAKSLNFSL